MPVDLLAEGQSPSAYEIFSGGHTYHPPAGADEAVNGQTVPALETDPFGPLGGWPKRVTDLGVALTALVLAAPIMLAVACLIRITTRGPALFAHSRVGYRGKPFACYKFRTMVPNADAALAEYLAGDPVAAREASTSCRSSSTSCAAR
jgi:exopolysaccharide production protein ExoY